MADGGDQALAILLRGINVGGNKKIPMAELRDLLDGLGYAGVRTHLQSGNAVVVTAEPAATVARRTEAALAERFGVEVRCLVLDRPYLHAVVDAHPLRDVADNGSRMFAHFLFEPPGDPTELEALDPGRVLLGDRVVYQWCPDGLLEAPDVALWIRRAWKTPVTARNWNTVEKLHTMLTPAASG